MIVKNVQKSDAMICVLNALTLCIRNNFFILFFREKDSLIVFQNGFG